MALHNYQFTHKADLCLLIPSILPLLLWAILIVLFHACINCGQVTILTEVIAVVIFFLINIVFTLLTIVPLSCRACGYNMCMKHYCYKPESHSVHVMEVMPLFILTLLPSLLGNESKISFVMVGVWRARRVYTMQYHTESFLQKLSPTLET